MSNEDDINRMATGDTQGRRTDSMTDRYMGLRTTNVLIKKRERKNDGRAIFA